MCGDAIEVPESRSHIRPASVTGEIPARTSTPGAAMSGLRMSPPVVVDGPRDENSATSGTSVVDSPAFTGTIAIVGFAAFAT